MPLMAIHADKQPAFLASQAQILTGEAGKVELNGFFIVARINHERPVKFVMQWFAHRMRTNTLRHGFQVAVEHLSQGTQSLKTVNFRVHQRYTDRRKIAKGLLKFADSALLL